MPIRVPCPGAKCNLPPFVLCPKAELRNLRGLYFSSAVDEASAVNIATVIPRAESRLAKRFPSIESVLGTGTPIHECLVTVSDDQGKPYRFFVAFREQQNLPINPALKKLLPDGDFRGEVVVMRAGARVMVVDLRGAKLALLAKRAVRASSSAR
ncbi:hypothetical protein GSI_04246 [Ganoderma sinense ZZ0214-1]|uniref:Uncharacterized protein n=1 Tax=Ganoderma sinense ZZ0214-1 TaxID=1077348 RepID=A0A2G8SIM7_9APHY|nr:hypothetical protein GSI_04246 [Ganoderma sinense ZZ0214-1]